MTSNPVRAEKRGGDYANLKVCRRGECSLRMLVETLFSQLAGCMGLKKISQRAWAYVEARLAFTAAAYNLLASWGGQLNTDLAVSGSASPSSSSEPGLNSTIG